MITIELKNERQLLLLNALVGIGLAVMTNQHREVAHIVGELFTRFEEYEAEELATKLTLSLEVLNKNPEAINII